MALEAFCFDLFRGMFGTGPLAMTGNAKAPGLERKNTAAAHTTFCPGRNMAHFTAIGAGHLGRNRPMQVLDLGQPLMTSSDHAPMGGNLGNAHGKDAKKYRQHKTGKQFISHLFFPGFSSR
jgi:hypothetical protein